MLFVQCCFSLKVRTYFAQSHLKRLGSRLCWIVTIHFPPLVDAASNTKVSQSDLTPPTFEQAHDGLWSRKVLVGDPQASEHFGSFQQSEALRAFGCKKTFLEVKQLTLAFVAKYIDSSCLQIDLRSN